MINPCATLAVISPATRARPWPRSGPVRVASSAARNGLVCEAARKGRSTRGRGAGGGELGREPDLPGRRGAPPRDRRAGAGPRRPAAAGAGAGHPALVQRGRRPPRGRPRVPGRAAVRDHGRRRRDDRVRDRRHPLRGAGRGAALPGFRAAQHRLAAAHLDRRGHRDRHPRVGRRQRDPRHGRRRARGRRRGRHAADRGPRAPGAGGDGRRPRDVRCDHPGRARDPADLPGAAGRLCRRAVGRRAGGVRRDHGGRLQREPDG